MRFADLKVGETFILAGERLRKISPLMAVGVSGGQQQLIRRSTRIELMDDRTIPGEPTENESRARLRSTLAAYHEGVQQLIRDCLPQDQLQEPLERLDAIKQSLFDELEL